MVTGLLTFGGAFGGGESTALAQGKAPAKGAPAKGAPAKGAAPAAGKAPAKGPAKPAAPKPLTEKQKKDAARKAYKDGEAKFKAGDYPAALELYKTADELLPIAATKYKIAVCRDKIGHVIGAAASYQAFLDSSPDAAKMADAIADSKARLDVLKKTPGKVRIAIEPPTVAKLQISVDNGPAQPARVETIDIPAPGGPSTDATQPPVAPTKIQGVAVTMAPGHHKITATAEGMDPSSAELDLSFAETRDVRVTLNPTPPPPPPPVVVAPEPVAPPPPPPPPPRSNVPAYVTLGLAGAGLVVGGVFGGLALSAKSAFNKNPTTENADKTDRNALISDMSFAVALTFGVTGAVLLLSNDSPAADPAKAASNGPRAPKKNAVRGFVTPYFSPQGGGAAAFLTF